MLSNTGMRYTVNVTRRISARSISVTGKTGPRNWLLSTILQEPQAIQKVSCSPIAVSGRMWPIVLKCFPVKPGDHIVSMLPMGHVFGMVYDFLYGFSAGAHIYFLTRMPSPKIISQSFSEIKPRVISCVPLIVEKIIKKDILPKVDSKIGKLLLKVPIVNDKIKSLARQAAMEIFGGNFDEIIIGGAPFNAEVEAFSQKDRFPLHHCLRHDECGPIICSAVGIH